MQIQKGMAIKFEAEEDIENAISDTGVGKAVIFGSQAGTVKIGTDPKRFAGVIISCEAGARSVKAGEAVGVLNDGIIEVKVNGAVSYGSYITLDDDGAFKAATISATPTAAEVLSICGVAMGTTTSSGGVIPALIYIRK